MEPLQVILFKWDAPRKHYMLIGNVAYSKDVNSTFNLYEGNLCCQTLLMEENYFLVNYI